MLGSVRVVGPAAALAVALALAGCGSSTAPAQADPPVPVVASTNVWGNVVTAIGGAHVAVTSVISDATADPHSYEATPRTQLAISRARVIVENGGGYDDFMDRLRRAAHSRATVIDAVDVSGKAAAAKAAEKAGGKGKAAGTSADIGLNEHVWYDIPSVTRVADRVETALIEADPRHAARFRAGGTAFRAGLQGLVAQERRDRARTAGVGVAITEPLPLYLLQALGAVDRTPPAFSHAVEEGTDVSPAVLQETTALFADGAVKALVYNAQTGDAQTALLLRAAAAAGVPAVPVTETLPHGLSYLTWMRQNIAAVTKALS